MPPAKTRMERTEGRWGAGNTGMGWRIRFRVRNLTPSPHNSNRTGTGSGVGDGLPMNGGEDSTKPTEYFFPQIQGGPQMRVGTELSGYAGNPVNLWE